MPSLLVACASDAPMPWDTRDARNHVAFPFLFTLILTVSLTTTWNRGNKHTKNQSYPFTRSDFFCFTFFFSSTDGWYGEEIKLLLNEDIELWVAWIREVNPLVVVLATTMLLELVLSVMDVHYGCWCSFTATMGKER